MVGGDILFWIWYDKKDCPYCGESISKDSFRCEHCERDLTQKTGSRGAQTGTRYQQDTYQRQSPPPPEEDGTGQKKER